MRIDYRSRQPGAYLYLVADPTGRILANVSKTWNQCSGHGMALSNVILNIGATAATETGYRAIAVVIALPERHARLLVGRDLGSGTVPRRRSAGRSCWRLNIMGMESAAIMALFVGQRASEAHRWKYPEGVTAHHGWRPDGQASGERFRR